MRPVAARSETQPAKNLQTMQLHSRAQRNVQSANPRARCVAVPVAAPRLRRAARSTCAAATPVDGVDGTTVGRTACAKQTRCRRALCTCFIFTCQPAAGPVDPLASCLVHPDPLVRLPGRLRLVAMLILRCRNHRSVPVIARLPTGLSVRQRCRSWARLGWRRSSRAASRRMRTGRCDITWALRTAALRFRHRSRVRVSSTQAAAPHLRQSLSVEIGLGSVGTTTPRRNF